MGKRDRESHLVIPYEQVHGPEAPSQRLTTSSLRL
jgi:hypothetical protein